MSSGTHFKGSIGRTWEDSKPWWPQPARAPADAPDIVYIILDDVGFGWLGCYGGPIDTPNIDKLAANGLLYNNWHTTALCSPSRACLLTGRNHHSVGMANVTELATGFPGYNGIMPKEKALLEPCCAITATIPTVLENGTTHQILMWGPKDPLTVGQQER